MRRITRLHTVVLAALAAGACGRTEVSHRANLLEPGAQSVGGSFQLTNNDTRAVYTYTPTSFSQRFTYPLTADATTVSNLGLTDGTIVTSSSVADTATMIGYPGFGEALPYNEVIRPLAQRIAVQLGYSDVCQMVTDSMLLTKVPRLVLTSAETTTDCLLNALKANPYLSYGTANDTNSTLVFGANCSGCHNSFMPTYQNDGSLRLAHDPFSPAVITRANYNRTTDDIRAALDRELALGPPAGASDKLKAAYVLAKEATIRQDSAGGTRWNFSRTAMATTQGIMSPMEIKNHGYLQAYAIFSGASNIGASAANTTTFTDTTLDQATDTFPATAFWLGGGRQGITDAIALTPPESVPQRSGRNPTINGPMTPNTIVGSAKSFVLQYTYPGLIESTLITNQTLNYLLSATYLRLPTLTSDAVTSTSLGMASWTNVSQLIAALPRFHAANLPTLGNSYFGLITAGLTDTLPTQALCNWSKTDMDAAVTLLNDKCSSCHMGVYYNATRNAYDLVQVGTAATSYIPTAANYSKAIAQAIVSANGNSTALPYAMARFRKASILNNLPALYTTEVTQSSSFRTGPWGYRNPVAPGGYPSMLAFLQAGGGTSTQSGYYVVPDLVRCGATAYQPLAGPSTDREGLRNIYGIPERLALIQHPSVSTTTLTSAQQTLLARFLEQVMARRGANVNGVKYGIVVPPPDSGS